MADSCTAMAELTMQVAGGLSVSADRGSAFGSRFVMRLADRVARALAIGRGNEPMIETFFQCPRGRRCLTAL
jgi:hypothetical protein